MNLFDGRMDAQVDLFTVSCLCCYLAFISVSKVQSITRRIVNIALSRLLEVLQKHFVRVLSTTMFNSTCSFIIHINLKPI